MGGGGCRRQDMASDSGSRSVPCHQVVDAWNGGPDSLFYTDTAKMTLQYNEAWKSLITAVRGNLTGEDDSRPCSYLGTILLDPFSILAIDGYFLDSQYSPIADYLQGQLLLTLPTTFQPSSSVDDPFSSSHHHSGSGAWKKLGLKSWGLGGGGGSGSGSSTPSRVPGSPVQNSSTPKNRAVSAGVPSSSLTTASASKWGGLGGWFGMGGGAETSTSTPATSAPATPAKQTKSVEADRTTAKEGEGVGEVNMDVDLASLHSALDSVEGDLKAGSGSEGGVEWRRRDVWLEGDERASLVYAIVSCWITMSRAVSRLTGPKMIGRSIPIGSTAKRDGRGRIASDGSKRRVQSSSEKSTHSQREDTAGRHEAKSTCKTFSYLPLRSLGLSSL